MLQGGDEGGVCIELFIPPAPPRGEGGADVHLVDGRIELNPGVASGEIPGIALEEHREVGVLEVADPVRQPEMAEIDDRYDVAALQILEGVVGELPVVAPVTQPGLVDRRAVAQERDPEFLDQGEVGLPVLVEAALLQLIDPIAAVVDGRHAVLDAGGEHEGKHGVLLGPHGPEIPKELYRLPVSASIRWFP